jgi:hypothetical protein
MSRQADDVARPGSQSREFVLPPAGGRGPRDPMGLLKHRRFKKDKPHWARPRRGFLVLVAASLALVLAAGGLVVFRPEPAGATLVLGYQVGETETYRLTASLESTVELAPGQLTSFLGSVSETIETHVAGVDPQGRATLDIRILEFSGQVDGQAIKAPEKKQFRVVVANDGRIIESAAGLAYVSLDGEPGSAPCLPLLPDKPVNPGDRWEVEHRQRLPRGIGDFRLHAFNELLSYDELAGLRTAVIQSTISGTMEADFNQADLREVMHASDVPAGVEASTFGQVWVNQTVWLDPAGGDFVRGDARAQFEMTLRVTGGPHSESAESFRGHYNGEMQIQMDRL